MTRESSAFKVHDVTPNTRPGNQGHGHLPGHSVVIGQWTDNGVVMPTVLPMAVSEALAVVRFAACHKHVRIAQAGQRERARERERDRECEGERKRETERETERESARAKKRGRARERKRERKRARDRKRKRERESAREKERERERFALESSSDGSSRFRAKRRILFARKILRGSSDSD